jgi:magnesium transporter
VSLPQRGAPASESLRMIIVHRIGNPTDIRLERHAPDNALDAIPADSVWIDLVTPSRDEDALVEAHTNIAVPTHEDQQDIEPSEILYTENGARYMTARIICDMQTARPKLAPVSFILTPKSLVTVRYDDPKSFALFANRAVKPGGCASNPEAVLSGLIEAIIDRAAEVLQKMGEGVDELSFGVFNSDSGRQTDRQQQVLKSLGRMGDVVSKVRESLVSIERMLLFLSAGVHGDSRTAELRSRARTTFRDLQSLEEHASFIAGKIQFLLDATLGLVNLEQNNIIKLFSVMAVIFMPPTLIASIYGMNFKVLPELQFEFGYPMALSMMLLSAILPYVFFRWRKWL